MASSHRLEYSKSTRAKCHGPVCKGASMAPGSLRYGKITRDALSQSSAVEWRHWGCVTSEILAELAAVLEDVPGFKQLKNVDQQKIRVALALRRVNPAEIPSSAASSAATPSHTGAVNLKKRKEPSSASGSTAAQSSQTESVENPAEDEAMEEEVRDELIVSMATQVVGIQYYRGLVGNGEEVIITREPTNQYDRNAIRVDNIGHAQVGHLPRAVASKLAPLMDSRSVTVEGIIQSGNRKHISSATLKMYCPSDKVAQTKPRLIWATPGQRGFDIPQTVRRANNNNRIPPPPISGKASRVPTQTPAQREHIKKQQEALQKAAELRDMISTLEKVNDEGRRSSLLDTLCSNEDILALPQYDTSQLHGLKVSLLKHQKQALAWCIEHEYPQLPKKEDEKPVQFWQFKKNGNRSFYYNIATKTPQEAPPLLGRGALFADAMGLGKTLTMLSLIIATKNDVPKNYSNATLVVIPLSVLSNWETQIQDHCDENTLSYCSYYGASRAQLGAQELAAYDVVFTTYQTVAGEHDNPKDQTAKKKKKTEKALFEVKWKRIILDEGHTIRNAKTKMSQAVCALDAERRWILSGTPILSIFSLRNIITHGAPQDLGSLMHFLQICRPLDNEEFFKRLLLRPLKDGIPSGVELLRALMSHICLRRTKEMQDSAGNALVPLPPVEMIKVPVALSDEARSLYDEVERLSSERFQSLMTGSTNAAIQSNALSMLTRLRQLALSPALLPRDYIQQLKQNDAGSGNSKQVMVTHELKQELQARLSQAIEDAEECPICFCVPLEPKITSCAHVFCFPCIKEVIARGPACPMDRRPLTLADLHDPLPPTDLTQPAFRSQADEMEEQMRNAPSAKIEQLVHLLKLTPSGEKSLVFSQFTIGKALDEHGIPFIRFDGQMSAKRRQEAIARFSVPIAPQATKTPEAAPRSRRRSGKASYDSATEEDGDFVISENDHSDEESTTTRKNKGKGKARQTQADSEFEDDSFGAMDNNPAVMLISLKAGALGLNLTVANNVYLMDPWWQEGIESQAIDRVNRIGQKRNIRVFQLISENTVESKVLEIQGRKKEIIQEAFSGVKRTETPRQHREARLHDLHELFGIRQEATAS
ncbi:hypothetical protein BT96DRAFT_952431 [Gymnopus androsaceus JB14]|uniref:Uncharacterized protein n=1 Tax=Gymnopus androsaceus JB14 TaxID=1447944 RepID=A0A6A4ILI3_9AGAR|nr:hypothetical protein BT96DRAFT_952431 [Gymnopus androsaceus JB14]